MYQHLVGVHNFKVFPGFQKLNKSQAYMQTIYRRLVSTMFHSLFDFFPVLSIPLISILCINTAVRESDFVVASFINPSPYHL